MFRPKTRDTRPITDRVKESLFNVLYKYGLPQGERVGDLFCGVGSLGLEALSRGAEFVTFVEQDPRVIAVLDRNIEKAAFVRESKVVRANAFRTGAPVGQLEQRYGLIFVDPPYARTQDVQADSPLGRLMDVLQDQVTCDAIVVVRTERRQALLEHYGRFQVIERREWGTMAITLLQMKNP